MRALTDYLANDNLKKSLNIDLNGDYLNQQMSIQDVLSDFLPVINTVSNIKNNVETPDYNLSKSITNISNDNATFIKSKDKDSQRLLYINQKILDTLNKIERNLVDEQDTSIKKQNAELKMSSTNYAPTFNKQNNDSLIFDSVFDGLEDFSKSKKSKVKKISKSKSNKPPKSIKTSKPNKPHSKVTPKSVGKKLLRVARLGKAIPLVGGLIAAGMSIYDGFTGWENASEILGINENELSTTNRLSSAAGEIISGLTFNVIDSKNLSQGINNFFGGNKTIEKYEKLKILDHNIYGNSKILDWDAVSKLPKEEIQKLIDIDDWSEEDLLKLKNIQQLPQYQPLQKNVVPLEKNISKTYAEQAANKTSSEEMTKMSLSELDKTLENTSDENLRYRLKYLKDTRKIIDDILKSNKTLESKITALNSFKDNWIKKLEYYKNNNSNMSLVAFENIKSIDNELNKLKGDISYNLQKPLTRTSKELYIKNIQSFRDAEYNPNIVKSFLNTPVMPNNFQKIEPFVLTPSNTKFNMDSRIGVLSEKYEVGKGGVGTISSGKGDPGGKSYGTWQLSSAAGTLNAFVNQCSGEIGDYLRKYPLASPQFDQTWKLISQQDPVGFEKLQYDFLYNNNYKPVLDYAKSQGINTSSITMQNVLWSQAIQHGLNGNKSIINEAIKEVGNNASIESIINALYNARTQYVSDLSKMPASTKQSLYNRYIHEGSDALAMLQSENLKNSGQPIDTQSKTKATAPKYLTPVSNKDIKTNYVETQFNNIKKSQEQQINILNATIQNNISNLPKPVNEEVEKDKDFNAITLMTDKDF